VCLYDVRCCLQCFDTVGWASEKHPACKNWVTRFWCCYLSGVMCKWFAYGPADATTTWSPFASLKLEWCNPLATCRHSAYLHKPSTVIVMSFPLWHSPRSHYDVILFVTSFATELATPTVTDEHVADILPRLVYKDSGWFNLSGVTYPGSPGKKALKGCLSVCIMWGRVDFVHCYE